MSENLEMAVAQCRKEEELLRFPKFSNEDALALGLKIKEVAESWGVGVAIDVEVNGTQVFHYNMPGSNKRHCMWIRRKHNMVQTSEISTYHAGKLLALLGKDVEKDWKLNANDYAILGGGFPIHVIGTGVIGSVACSALPHEDDHRLLLTALCSVLGVDMESLK